jgi:N-acetylmuramoyl-L-alanine amidase-like protein
MPTLIVQKGHCNRRAGATGTTGEQAYVTRVADACHRLLDGLDGWVVRRTLADVNDYAGSAFVAVHCDGSTNANARGASVGYRTPEGQTFGQAWKLAYARRGWTGFRPDNYTTALADYYGTRKAVNAGTRRAIVIECGFRTSPTDRALLDGPGGPERVALAIGDALGITGEDEDMAVEDVERMVWKGGNVPGVVAEDTLVARVRDLERMVWAGGAVNGAVDPASLIGQVRRIEGKLDDLIAKLGN